MHWSNYGAMLAANPVVASVLPDVVGPPIMHWGGSHPHFRSIQEWVEKQLVYVAIQPWETLRLDSTNIWKARAVCRYSIYYHIAHVEEVPGSRARQVGSFDLDTGKHRTIREVFDDILQWYALSYWSLRASEFPLVFDAVIRDAHGSVPGKKYPEQAINIWIPPEGLMPSTTS